MIERNSITKFSVDWTTYQA